jgi:hypothetical protein
MASVCQELLFTLFICKLILQVDQCVLAVYLIMIIIK